MSTIELRVVQISDTHLSPEFSAPRRNLLRVARFVNEQLKPSLVVNTGDIVALDPDDERARASAREQHGAFAAPVRFLPGNHDVGEPGPAPWMGIGVSSERVAAHRRTFGDDRFAVESEHWLVLGCNSELFGSGLPEERDQWDWLARQARRAASRRVALFLHKPLWPPRTTPSEAALCVPFAAADRIRALFAPARLRAVASGHLHRYRRRLRGDLIEVWAPSTAFMGQTDTEPAHFEQLGVVEWTFLPSKVAASFRAPVDLEERQLKDDPDLVAVLERFQRREDEPGADGAR